MTPSHPTKPDPVVRVFVQQPTIPEYRVTVFERLAGEADLSIELHASRRIALSADSCDHDFSFPVHFHPCRSWLRHSIFWQSGMHLPRNFEPGDVLVVGANLRFLSSLHLAFQARLRSLGVVWWGHGRPSGGSMSPFDRLRRAWTDWVADVHLVYTSKEAEAYAKTGYDPETVFATNNTIDCEPISGAIAEWSEGDLAAFEQRENPAGNTRLLFCGRLTQKASLGVGFEALSQLGTNYELVIIGDGPERQALESRAQALGVHQRVRFVGEIFDQHELAPWFLSASCFVYPGEIGLSMFHAFAYRLGVITHGDEDSQMPEFAALRDGHNGLIYVRGSDSDLAKKIRQLTANPDTARRFGMNALRTIEKEFSMDAMIANFGAAIRAASRAHRPAPMAQ
jgi:glycosyltransferase involved in cell wall biosynthesis